MKDIFVFDESSTIAAATGKNERGGEDSSAKQLLERIVVNCHAMAFSSELYARTLSRLDNLKGIDSPFVGEVLSLFTSIIRNTEKFVFDPDPPVLEDETHIPEDDRYWIRLAIHTRAIAITTDNRLLDTLNQTSITASHSLAILRPESALARFL